MNSKYYLKIFQLEAYKPLRFLRWIARNHLRPSCWGKEQPVWTPKAVLLYRLAWLYSLALIALALTYSFFAGVLLAGLLWSNSYLPLILALLSVRPYEMANRLRVKSKIRQKVLSLKNLSVIGITGSYGKTSTKMILNHLLPGSLMTPKSYNTLFGIWKVVDYELCDRFRYFICEMGAYKRGDVREFCELTLPHVGVLTGINEQHLERFGSIENTTQAKFEITQYLRNGATAIVNLDNQRIRDHLQYSSVPLIGYSIEGHYSDRCKDLVQITAWGIADYKTSFTIRYAGKDYQATTPLLGRAHLSNVLAAFTVATFLGEPVEAVLARIATLPQIPHRLECRRSEGYTLLDNSYSSNPTSFRDSLDALKRFPSGKKVLITPGLVELGVEEVPIHQELGHLAAEMCDEIFLVGDNQKTRALRAGLEKAQFPQERISVLKNRSQMLDYLRGKAGTGDVVLLENDVPDQYL